MTIHKTEQQIFDSEAVKMLNVMIDDKATEMQRWGKILEEKFQNIQPDNIKVRTYLEGKQGYGSEKFVKVPINGFVANEIASICARITNLETEINDLVRTKLRLARDCDFDDGGHLQNKVFNIPLPTDSI